MSRDQHVHSLGGGGRAWEEVRLGQTGRQGGLGRRVPGSLASTCPMQLLLLAGCMSGNELCLVE